VHARQAGPHRQAAMHQQTRCRAMCPAAHHADASSLKRISRPPALVRAAGASAGVSRLQTAFLACLARSDLQSLLVCSSAAAAAAATHPAVESCLLAVTADACPHAQFGPSAYVSQHVVKPRFILLANAYLLERHRSKLTDTCKSCAHDGWEQLRVLCRQRAVCACAPRLRTPSSPCST